MPTNVHPSARICDEIARTIRFCYTFFSENVDQFSISKAGIILMAARLTTKQKRDRRLKIKRRKLRRQKRGI